VRYQEQHNRILHCRRRQRERERQEERRDRDSLLVVVVVEMALVLKGRRRPVAEEYWERLGFYRARLAVVLVVVC